MSPLDHNVRGARRRFAERLPTTALAGVLAAMLAAPVIADDRDPTQFPTTEEVGGDVFAEGIQPGDKFPTDIELYNERGEPVEIGDLIKGKRTAIAMFITAAPAAVAELKQLEQAMDGSAKTQLLFLNTDLVGTALTGGDRIRETARTLRVVKHEESLSTPMFVAPNNVFHPNGLGNRLGVRSLPTTILVDAQGRVEKVFVGPQKWERGAI